jgi:predicted DNA-binding transcriptional regulator AlpA
MIEKRIQAAAVRQLCGGVSDMWLWRKLRDDPTFPRQVYIGRRRFWREADIIAWLESQPTKNAA